MLTNEQIQNNKESILELLAKVQTRDPTKIIDFLQRSDYFTAPASTMFHGNFEGGLAAHSYAIYQEFSERVDHYKLAVPEESKILTSLLHDMCKVNLYVPNILKEGKLSDSKPYKTNDDFPIGHGEKSVIMIQPLIELTPQEVGIIRWHMGPYDPAWTDVRDKVIKKWPEALLFHHIDEEVSQFYGL